MSADYFYVGLGYRNLFSNGLDLRKMARSRANRMRFYFRTLLLIYALLGAGQYTVAQEIIYPFGYNISSSYQLSSTDFSTMDTLLVTWTIANNEGFDLTNMYLAENMPIEFTILSYSVQISSSPISHFFSGPVPGQMIPSFNAYRWVIDLPAEDDSLNRPLTPGETLILEYAAICSTEGEFFLPFHTLCCYGDSTGIFSTADTIFLTVSPGLGTYEQPHVLAEKSLVSLAYPNPFNSEVMIRFDSNIGVESHVRLAVYDVTGREIFCNEISGLSGKGTIRWRPKNDIASGLYFYRLTYGRVASIGKMTFLK